MKLTFLVVFNDFSEKQHEFEKPAGAHPESELAISTAFLTADEPERKAISICRVHNGKLYGGWITRKDAAPAILDTLDAKVSRLM